MMLRKTAITVALAAAVVLADACSPQEGDPFTEEAMTPKLYRVIMPVADIDEAQRFYAALFDTPGERVSPGRHYYDLGGVILALYDPAADGDPVGEGWRHHENQYVYIAVDALEVFFARARKAGATMLSEQIETMPWGERLFYIRDPFGNPVCFVDAATVFTGSAADGGGLGSN